MVGLHFGHISVGSRVHLKQRGMIPQPLRLLSPLPTTTHSLNPLLQHNLVRSMAADCPYLVSFYHPVGFYPTCCSTRFHVPAVSPA